ncbi:MAG: acyl-CoA dehydrogenase family protein [Thermodesulfobacteriota bacterium]|nr:acyl-CoA dehydrogenase family protein [Thermodesulfobacteriota bacterium]
MDFSFDEETLILLDSFSKFIKRELILKIEQNNLNHNRDIPIDILEDVRKRSAELGFYGIHMPKEVGGGGLSNIGTCALREEASKSGCILAPLALSGPEGTSPVFLFCNEDQKKKYVYPLINAEKTTCFAFTEPEAGSDPNGIKTTARKDGDFYILNGLKHYITNADRADYAVIMALTDPKLGLGGGLSAFIVEKETPGYRIGRIHDFMGSFVGVNQAEIILEDCKVPKENMIGKEGNAFISLMSFVAAGRLGIGASSVGIAHYLLEQCKEYANTRVQFGRPISRNQAIQWMLAEMATELYAARSMVYHCAWMVDQGKDAFKESSMVKLFATEMVGRVADKAVQIFGGMGLSKELPIEAIYRNVRALRIVEGTSEIQKIIIYRAL